jgi:hypothetical protein
MTYRVAASVLEQMFPVDAGKSHETLRTHTLKLGEQLQDRAVIAPTTAATAIAISVDSTFIRSCEDGERHLEVRVGNVETETGGRQVFGAVAKADTDIVELIRRNLTAVGQTDDTELTGFTDGCPALRSILAAAGVAQPPILDWFHIAMRLQHLKQIAGGLSTDDAARAAAKTVIVEEVERLRWRLWNGKAKDAQISIGRIRKVMHAFQGELGSRRSDAPSRKLWTALAKLDGYLSGQSKWLVNYAERHRAGLRVGTALTEATANFLVNRRMNKSQQMRWTRRGQTCCCRSVAPSTMERSAPGSASGLSLPLGCLQKYRWQPDPQSLDSSLTVQLAGSGHPRLRLPDGRVFRLSRTAIPPPASGTAKGILSYASSVGDSRAMSYKSQVIAMRRSCGTGTPSGLLDKHTSCARSI